MTETLGSLPGWEGGSEQIWRDVRLPPDEDAELRRQVAIDAAALGHEPVVESHDGATRFVLTTPSVGGVSEIDISLAAHISDLAHRISSAERGIAAEGAQPEVARFRPARGTVPEPRITGVPTSTGGGIPQVPLPSARPHDAEPGMSSEQTNP